MYLRLGRWCYRHRVIVLAIWVALVIGVNVASSTIGTAFSNDTEAPASESGTGLEILEESFGGVGLDGIRGTIVFQADQGVQDPEVRSAMESLFATVESRTDARVTSPYTPLGGRQIAQDGPLAGEVAFAEVFVPGAFSEPGAAADIGVLIQEAAPDLPGLRVEVGGESFAEFEPPESELIGLGFAIVILIVSFGSVLAMGLPIGTAICGVSVGVALAGLLSNLTVVPEFATIIGAMIGLGVGIDYALFIVTRFRENLELGDDTETATGWAMDTAGRAVVFAGVTVVASLLGLLLIGLQFVAGLGLAASTTVFVTLLASVTLLPALLGFAKLRVEVTRWRGLIAAAFVAAGFVATGLQLPRLAGALMGAAVLTVLASFVVGPLRREVPPRRRKPLRETGWHRWSRQIQRRPWPIAVAGTLLLVVISLPIFGIRLGFSDEGNFPEETTTRQAYDLLAEGFGPGFNGPFFAVARLDDPADLASMQVVADAIAADPGVVGVSPVIPSDLEDPAASDAALLQVIPATAPQDEATDETVQRLRDEVIPAAEPDGLEVVLTGQVPGSMDFSNYLGERSLLFFGVVLLVSFVLLMLVFRSILVPIKAVIMNMLSISGAYGVVVAVFQWGWTSDVTGIEAAPIEPFVPMMMFAIVFGLSMDYEVFLLSRIKEEYARHDDATDSVADGLAATARVISAAAAIMVVVFGSFLLEDNRITRLFGTGLGLAVLLDATLVRMLLVPSTMQLLGRRNWWIPRWLDRALPELNVEGTPRHLAPETDVSTTEPPTGATVDEAPVPTGPDATGPDTTGPDAGDPVTRDDLARAVTAVADVVDGDRATRGRSGGVATAVRDRDAAPVEPAVEPSPDGAGGSAPAAGRGDGATWVVRLRTPTDG